MMDRKDFSTEIGGKKMTASFSRLADQTNSSVILKYGNSAVLATAVMSRNDKDMPYFPLVVDYEEKYYAAGRILGGRFIKREGRPSDEAILSGRMVDRTIRPLFDHAMRREIQIIITVLAIDEENDPGVLAINAASLALATSDIPWNGPVSAVSIGLNGEDDFMVNPTYQVENGRRLDLLVCGKDGNVNMIEAGAKEIDEDTLKNALKKASEEIEKIQEFQKSIVKEMGKEKQNVEVKKVSEEAKALFEEVVMPKIDSAIFSGDKNTIPRLEDEWIDVLKEKIDGEAEGPARDYYNHRVDEIIHSEGITKDRRADGRAMDELRPLYAEAGGISEVLHGTGIFFRGGTHVLSVLTLGGPKDAQLIEGMEERGEKRFMHHYNFPPFSVGETGRMGGINRRATGHGALAEKALMATLPTEEEFPYTIRLVSESTASNGSTSMASVCASTIALMDGGVPIKRPTTGIAMGLLLDEKDSSKYKIMTDIQGPEDHHGDMDFKVAGTEAGITAIQMDVKVDGVPVNILGEALEQAKKARLQILEVIKKGIEAPRAEISAHAPKILTMNIDPSEIGMLIGTGGKTIQGITKETEAEIEIEDTGLVTIFGRSGSAEKAKKVITEMFRKPVKGEEYDGEIVKILDFGFFVKIGPNKEGLVHVSEIAPYRIANVEKYFKVGEIVPVVVKEIDDQGRTNFSIKERDPDFAKSRGIPEDTNPQSHGGGNHRPSGGRPHGGGRR